MPFKVEDGTGFSDSNSYGSVEEADAYHTLRGNGAWVSATTDQKQAALVQATDYVDQRYSARYVGCMKTGTQALAWPRSLTGTTEWNDTVIPQKLRYACFEYADRALSTKLAPDLAYDDSGVGRVITHEKVGPIERDYSIVGGDFATATILRPYPGADMYLRGLVMASGGVYR